MTTKQEYNREYRAKNLEKLRAANRAWYAANREHALANARKWRAVRYLQNASA